MKADELLTRLRTRQAADLRMCFPGLSERDAIQILAARPQHAVYILQQCFGYPEEDAKAAWNDFVMRYIDGGDNGGSDRCCSHGETFSATHRLPPIRWCSTCGANSVTSAAQTGTGWQ